MGFFYSLGNWIWDGIILNTIFGTIALAILLLGWAVLRTFLIELAGHEDFRRLMNTRQDNPWKVALFCLLTPLGVIGTLGYIFGLVLATINIVPTILGNYIPFVWWGEKDAWLLWEYLSYILASPIAFYYEVAFGALAHPIIAIVLLLIVCFGCFGYLIPNGENRGSLSNTNREYAALSFATFLAFFGLIAIIAFGSIANFFYQWEHDIGVDAEYDDDEMPLFGYDSEEYHETTETYTYSDTVYTVNEGDGGKLTLEPGSDHIYSCLSLDSNADEVDIFRFNSSNESYQQYHIRIWSTSDIQVSANMDYGSPVWSSYRESYSGQTVLSQNFHTSQLEQYIREDFYNLWGFDLQPNSTGLLKYHVAYVHAPNGITNETNQTIDTLLSSVDDPASCGLYAFTGNAIEPRVRLSLLSYVCAGIFMMGCLIHRYFVILGNRGTTDNRTLFRTFIHSQMISFAFYCLVIVLFDPLNGLGITGFRLDAIVEAIFFASKLVIGLVSVVLLTVFSIALYRQRGLIGGIVAPILERERALRDIEQDWF